MVICTYEDRRSDLVGLRLLLLSLARICPDVPIFVFCPIELHSSLSSIITQKMAIVEPTDLSSSGWSVKPAVLLKLLGDGQAEVLWLDSDIIVTRDFRKLFENLGRHVMTVAEEPYWACYGSKIDRATLWGFQSVRAFDRPVNSAVVRVTSEHWSLLEMWNLLLQSREYRDAQVRSFSERPPHVAGDQDVLDALLCSSKFANIEIRLVRSGSEIAQCHMADGYSVLERLKNLGQGLPPFVHTQGAKPWRCPGRRPYYLDVSPYLFAARTYASELNEETVWLNPSSLLGKLLWAMSGRSANIAGLPLALAAQMQRDIRIRSRLRQLLAHRADTG